VELREIARRTQPYLVGVSALLLAGGALAFPRWPLGSMLGDGCDGRHPCSESLLRRASPRSSRELFQPVNIVGPIDQRDEISKKRAELEAAGFRQEDFERAMSCVTLVYCPSAGSDEISSQSGFDVAVPGQLTMTAHGFYNMTQTAERGPIRESFAPRNSFEGCVARNFSHPKDLVPLVISAEQQSQLRTVSPTEHYHLQDWAVIKLRRPLNGCHPYPADRSGKPLQAGDTVINISYPSEGMESRATGKEPVAQVCHVRDIYNLGAGVIAGTDCSGSPGASGGVLLGWVSDSNDPKVRTGHFEAKGMVVSSAPRFNDYKDYNLSTHDRHKASGTFALGMKGNFLRANLHCCDVGAGYGMLLR
jgi:hypothetical protein